MGSRVFAVVNAVFAVLFLISAALQFNDSDPKRWIAVYAAAAAACLFARRVRHGAWLAVAIGVVSLAWAATLSPILPELRLAELALIHYLVVGGPNRDVDQIMAVVRKPDGARADALVRDLLSHARWVAAIAPKRSADAPGSPAAAPQP